MRHRPQPTGAQAAFLVTLCFLAAGLSGCGANRVAAWDRDILAKRAMQLNTHPIVTAAREHIYFSKEGSSGGRTFDGGGCGCN
jgi:hypothetical protein